MFSILIPSFNYLEYLKLCVKSIRKNSNFNHQIIIHVNEGRDGTMEYVKKNKKINTYLGSYIKDNIDLILASFYNEFTG